MSKTVNPEDVLTIARKKIGKEWTTGTYGYLNGGVCALGAISYARRTLAPTPFDQGNALMGPMPDGNGIDEAIRLLHAALPKKDQAETEDYYCMRDAIVSYNDRGNKHGVKKHHRTITKWFDRAVKLVKEAK